MPRPRQTFEIVPGTLSWEEVYPVKLMNWEQRGALITQVRIELGQAVRQIDGLWLHVGKYWRFIMRNKLYKFWGEHIKNANQLVRELNLGVSRTTLDHYARVYGMFGKYLTENSLCPPFSKLLMVHPMIEKAEFESQEAREQAIAEWAHKANDLPVAALRDEIREARGLITSEQCTHPAAQCQLWSRCGCCGKWLELVPNIGETIYGSKTAKGHKGKGGQGMEFTRPNARPDMPGVQQPPNERRSSYRGQETQGNSANLAERFRRMLSVPPMARSPEESGQVHANYPDDQEWLSHQAQRRLGAQDARAQHDAMRYASQQQQQQGGTYGGIPGGLSGFAGAPGQAGHSVSPHSVDSLLTARLETHTATSDILRSGTSLYHQYLSDALRPVEDAEPLPVIERRALPTGQPATRAIPERGSRNYWEAICHEADVPVLSDRAVQRPVRARTDGEVEDGG